MGVLDENKNRQLITAIIVLLIAIIVVILIIIIKVQLDSAAVANTA